MPLSFLYHHPSPLRNFVTPLAIMCNSFFFPLSAVVHYRPSTLTYTLTPLGPVSLRGTIAVVLSTLFLLSLSTWYDSIWVSWLFYLLSVGPIDPIAPRLCMNEA